MRVLVTGVAGFIGSATASLLLEAGASVVGVDDFSTGTLDVVPKGVEFIETSIQNPQLVEGVGQVDACIHLAGLIDSAGSMHQRERYFEQNVTGANNLFRTLQNHGVQNIIVSSSAAVYGGDHLMPVGEDEALAPQSAYGETKVAVDRHLDQLAKEGVFRSASLRYFNAAGSFRGIPEKHQGESHLIPLAIDSMLGRREPLTLYGVDFPTPDGTCIRDYVHVEDVARAHLLALEALQANERIVVNLGTGVGFSNREVIAAIEEISSRPVPIEIAPRRSGDAMVLVAKNDRARSVLGWTPQYSARDCISDALASRI
jgi:UDP-glucose 4-epimerase